MSHAQLLSAVLDRLLPSVDELGGAGELGLTETALRDPLLAAAPHAIASVLDALGGEFESSEPRAQDEALRSVEQREPDAFAILISVAYNAYYSDPRVLARLDRLTEYKAGAPQPGGYEIEPFEETMLAQIRQREAFWRKVN
ncbi:MAG: hypothetical protein ACR2OD_10780 [Gaiellaceae bacterium]